MRTELAAVAIDRRRARPRQTAARTVLAFCAMLCGVAARAQTVQAPVFDVASIRPSSGRVEFERNGATRLDHGTLVMHDVTVSTCMQWAYRLPAPQIAGPASLTEVHYDILAKSDPDSTEAQMRDRMQALLAERFHLTFHRETRPLKVYTLVVAKGGLKMTPSTEGDAMTHQNSATGMVGHAATVQEIADYMADPLGAPVTDATGLKGRYNFTIDFTPYVDMAQSDVRPDPAAVIGRALKGDLGLDMVRATQPVKVLVVDHVEPPSGN